jgi:hypothetical protein
MDFMRRFKGPARRQKCPDYSLQAAVRIRVPAFRWPPIQDVLRLMP